MYKLNIEVEKNQHAQEYSSIEQVLRKKRGNQKNKLLFMLKNYEFYEFLLLYNSMNYCQSHSEIVSFFFYLKTDFSFDLK